MIRAEFVDCDTRSFFTPTLARQNVGIITGDVSGFFVIECDTAEHGEGINGAAVLRRWESMHGKLPPTLMARSPSGSVHYYFKHPGSRASRSGWPPTYSEPGSGVDCKGDGGMVLAPPSHPPATACDQEQAREEGRLLSMDQRGMPIAEAPRWLLNIVTEQGARSRNAGALQ